MIPKLGQNQMSEMKETKKMKIIALYEWTPKQFEPVPNPQNSSFFAPQSQKIILTSDTIKKQKLMKT